MRWRKTEGNKMCEEEFKVASGERKEIAEAASEERKEAKEDRKEIAESLREQLTRIEQQGSKSSPLTSQTNKQ